MARSCWDFGDRESDEYADWAEAAKQMQRRADVYCGNGVAACTTYMARRVVHAKSGRGRNPRPRPGTTPCSCSSAPWKAIARSAMRGPGDSGTRDTDGRLHRGWIESIASPRVDCWRRRPSCTMSSRLPMLLLFLSDDSVERLPDEEAGVQGICEVAPGIGQLCPSCTATARRSTATRRKCLGCTATRFQQWQ